MRDERDTRKSPRDEHVGMVIQLVRDRRQPVQEVNGAAEVLELEFAPDAVAVLLPRVIEIGKPGLHIFIAQYRHLLSPSCQHTHW